MKIRDGKRPVRVGVEQNVSSECDVTLELYCIKCGQTEYLNRKMLLVVKWCNKQDVGMLSMGHTSAIIDTSKRHHATDEVVHKPECVDSCNKNMGAVDKTDMQISLMECTRKTRKWYIYLFDSV